MYYVYVDGLEFFGRHGVTPEEQSIGHAFRADVRLAVDGRADDTDALADTVDYSAVAATVVRVSDSRSFATVEALAKSVAEAVLACCPLAVEVRCKVSKLRPPMPYFAASCAAEVTVTRK